MTCAFVTNRGRPRRTTSDSRRRPFRCRRSRNRGRISRRRAVPISVPASRRRKRRSDPNRARRSRGAVRRGRADGGEGAVCPCDRNPCRHKIRLLYATALFQSYNGRVIFNVKKISLTYRFFQYGNEIFTDFCQNFSAEFRICQFRMPHYSDFNISTLRSRGDFFSHFRVENFMLV